MNDYQRGQIEALNYVLKYTRSLRTVLGRPPAFVAACEEIKFACRAAATRVQQGKPMESKSVTCKENIKRLFEVWVEGFLDTGQEGVPVPALCLGQQEAESFREACDIVCNGSERYTYDAEHGTLWGRKLFDNEADARKAFG